MAATDGDGIPFHVGMVYIMREALVEKFNPLTWLSPYQSAIVGACTQDTDHKRNCATILTNLCKMPGDAWFDDLVKAVEKQDTKLADMLQCKNVKDMPHYRNIVRKTIVITHRLYTSDVLPALKSHYCLTESECAAITSCNDIVVANETLLRYLPLHRDKWYDVFMEALGTTDNNMPVRRLIDIDYRPKNKDRGSSSSYVISEKQAPKFSVTEVDANLFDDWCFVTSSSSSNSLSLDGIQDITENSASAKERLILRQYQNELAEPALSGENVIICAPTGSGKTYVAARILQNHIDLKKKAGEPFKVAFLVPMTSLLDQQYSVLSKYVTGCKLIAIRSGSSVPKAIIIQNCDVVVLTPQLLINVLNETDDTSNRVVIGDFSMLIFDECHHVTKEHPYVQLLRFLLARKFQNSYSTKSSTQVIGLSASLGVGKSDSIDSAQSHIIRICAWMDCSVISVVRKYKNELEALINLPTDDIVKVSGSEDDQFPNHIEKMMAKIEGRVIPLLDSVSRGKKEIRPLVVTPPKNRLRAEYISWLFNWLWKIPSFNESNTRWQIHSYLEHLQVYQNALDISVHLPVSHATEYLSSMYGKLRMSEATDVDKKLNDELKGEIDLLKMLTYDSKKNSLSDGLRDILVKHFAERPDSRAIVFVRTRELANGVMNFIKCDQQLAHLNPVRLTAFNVSQDQHGMCKQEMDQNLELFRVGGSKVLVATTIAEEGLDIHQCGLVVKYNHVTNEIALIQRKGRGRAAGSKSILLTRENVILNKEVLNMLRSKMMDTALELISANGSAWLKQQVQFLQKSFIQEMQLALMAERKLNISLSGASYSLQCKKCGAQLTKSTDVRLASSTFYVVVDPTIWSRLVVQPKAEPRVFQNTVVAGRVCCQKCRHECGSIVKFAEVFYPALKIESLCLVKDQTKERIVVRKWKSVQEKYFVVPAVKQNDSVAMFSALSKGYIDQMNKCIVSVTNLQLSEMAE